jgi:catechol 2,3-dioxygenase-like lactoylglutathione lyase family enzyme
MPEHPGPVTADDVTAAVAAAVAALRVGVGGDWAAPAGDLEWSCWVTAEHVADDLFYYAIELGAPGHPGYLPIEAEPRAPGEEANTIRSEPAAGPEGLFAVLSACAAVLAAMVRVTPPSVRAHHSFGPADADASAAMGVLETLVHTRDIAKGLGVPWEPDHGLCARVLARLMPEVEPAGDPWTTLLWACGRIALPGRPRREDWRWTNDGPAVRPVQRLGLVTLVVPGYDEAIAFYVDAIGFALAEDTAMGDGKRWVVVAPPGGQGASLLLARADTGAQRARIGDQTGGRVALFLSTSDFDADHTRMKAAGVEFLEEPRREPYGMVAVFADPFGNTWDLIQHVLV